jgi:alkaline phosphatase
MKRIFTAIIIAASVLTGVNLSAQEYPVLIHSHNDYWRPVPFWTAYSSKLYSYEADVYYVDGQIYVAHDREDIKPENTLEKLYIEPIVSVYKANEGKPWKDAKHGIQLLVDIKDETDPSMQALSEAFGRYPEVFDRSVNRTENRRGTYRSLPGSRDSSRCRKSHACA